MARASRAVYASMATVDTRGRPRSRIVHPIWEGPIGWIISRADGLKSKHLARNPHVSLAYIQDSERPVYVDCTAEWEHNRAEKLRVWDVIKTTPPPMGFDPGPWYKSVDSPDFGLLKLTPWRIELYTLGGEPIIWRQG